MLCRKPFTGGPVPFGCGQCLPCRINRRRQWMWRQFLESLTHDENCFVTLTYKDTPPGGNLSPRDTQLWLKRLRKLIEPAKVRYFLVGEYGPQTLRPHYHASLFGLGVAHSALVQEAWGLGYTQVSEFNEITAQYVAGYVVKKLTDSTDPRLNGHSPEFARMSTKPGIGSSAMKIIAQQLSGVHGTSMISSTGDVPSQLKIGRRSIPLGRYLLSRLRIETGLTSEAIDEAKALKTYDRSIELQALFKAALTDKTALTSTEVYLQSVHQKILNVESRSRIFKKRDTL